jgi:hypothetical protein
MVRYSFCLALALVAAFSCTAAAQNRPPTVQQNKSDSLLLSEIPQVVEQWTHRCGAYETDRVLNASQCWRDAASALTRYTDGISENLVKKVEELQAVWLERAAQLHSSEMSLSEGAPLVARQVTIRSAGLVRTSPLLRKAPPIKTRQAVVRTKKPSQARKVASRKEKKSNPRNTDAKKKVAKTQSPQAAKSAQGKKIKINAAAEQVPIQHKLKRKKRLWLAQ